MIYVTGDTHAERMHFLNYRIDPCWTETDIHIVCGDWSFLLRANDAEHQFLDLLEQRPCTFCFVDGNHENFPAIFRYPEEVWNGGRIHRIRKNVIHLMRGQVYTIQGKKIFTFGGAYSVDRKYRTPSADWWDQELPLPEEYREAIRNLELHGNQVDYILTHTAPREMIRRMGYEPDPHEMELSGFLEYVMYQVKHRHWYCGHWHMDRDLTDTFTLLWYDTRNLE